MAKFGSMPFNHQVHEDKNTEFSSEMYRNMDEKKKK